MNTEALIGWSASLVLALTVGSQVLKQWRERQCEGVSRLLFAGQSLASALFLVYAWLGGNVVFIVSNAFMLAMGVAGQAILLRNRKADNGASTSNKVPSAH